MPQDITQTINDQGGANGPAGDGTDTMIALDQVNSLVSNGHVEGASVSNSGDGLFNHDSLTSTGGSLTDTQVGPVGTSETASGSGTVTTDANATAQLDAFTQSIVLGANIQYNSFNLSVVGHDAIGNAGDIHHS
jgi:hypothetical protein